MIKTNRIRPLIVFVGLFIAAMLFQTGSSGIGTLVAMGLMGCCVFFYLLEYGVKVKLIFPSVCLLFFMIIVSFVSALYAGLPSYYYKLISQAFLFFLLLGIKPVNQREETYLTVMFLASALFYAVAGILASANRTVHGDFELFGAALDPNFFGIPIAAASTVLLYIVLMKKGRYTLLLLPYIILLIALLYTSSRGNMLAWIVGNGVVMICFIFSGKIPLGRKCLYLTLLLVLAVSLYGYIEINFADSWERMTSIGEEGSDNGRFDLWHYALAEWETHPVFGGGLMSNYKVIGAGAHNTFVQVLTECGIVGIFLYVLMIGSLLRRTFRYNKMYFCLLCGMLIQIAFLDALENRCVWSIFCWLAVLPIADASQNGQPQTKGKILHGYYKKTSV